VYRVYGAEAFDFAADPPQDQTVTNYVTAATTYDGESRTISQLDSTLTDGEPVVVVVRTQGSPSPTTLVLARRLGSDDPPVYADGEVRLDLDFTPTAVAGIFLRDDYNFALPPEQQTARNYLLRETRYSPATRMLSELNPLLEDGTEVHVVCSGADGANLTLTASATEWAIEDLELEGLRSDERYFYRVISRKRVRLAPDQTVSVPSRPSETVTVAVFDNSVPAPPEWVGLSWTESADGPAARLEWLAAAPEAICTVFRRPAGGERRLVQDGLPGEWDQAAGVTRFVFVDGGADPAGAHHYSLRLKNRLGRLSPLSAEEPLEARP